MIYRRAMFSFLVLLALLVPGVALAAMLGWRPSLIGHSPDQSGANFRLIEIAITGLNRNLS